MKQSIMRFVRVSPAMVIAMLALFVALTGTAVATTSALITGNQIKNSSITGADIKNKSLRPIDFRGSVRGPRGLRGLTGATGAPGAAGAPGAKGDKGDAGTPATKLFASVTADCGSLDRGSGTTGVVLNFAARCDVRFNQNVRDCVPTASFRGTDGGNWQLTVNTQRDAPSLVQLDTDEVAVTFRDNVGNLLIAGRPPYQLIVVC